MNSAFSRKYGPWAFVAGASMGIGEAFSRQLAARGLNLVLTARRPAPLGALAEELPGQGVEVRAVPLDLGAEELLDELRPEIADLEIGLLVYNACYSYIGEFFASDLSTKLQIIDVNCRGPLMLVSELAPPMIERKRGGIILMSSASGFQGQAMISAYAASKAFNTVLGEGLWEELRHHGVDVLSFIAGATRTPNFERETPKEKQAGSFPMLPEAVAKEALESLGKGPIGIAGRVNKVACFLFCRLLPRRMAVEIMSKQLRKMYQP
jgi:short-subunit dehydrogenase